LDNQKPQQRSKNDRQQCRINKRPYRNRTLRWHQIRKNEHYGKFDNEGHRQNAEKKPQRPQGLQIVIDACWHVAELKSTGNSEKKATVRNHILNLLREIRMRLPGKPRQQLFRIRANPGIPKKWHFVFFSCRSTAVPVTATMSQRSRLVYGLLAVACFTFDNMAAKPLPFSAQG
jgi:hypothetical protein